MRPAKCNDLVRRSLASRLNGMAAMRLQDVFEIGEAGPLPFVGLGLLGLAVPYFVPSLRPELGGVLKASAKLFLEAELGADNQLTDSLVDSSVDALMRVMPEATEEERHRHTDRELDRFFSRARAASHRRGHNREDANRRYMKHLSRMERKLKHRQQRAGPGPARALEHAVGRIAGERRAGLGAGLGAGIGKTNPGGALHPPS